MTPTRHITAWISTQNIPPGYQLAAQLKLTIKQGLFWIANIAAALLFLTGGYGFVRIAWYIKPDFSLTTTFFQLASWWSLLYLFIMLVLHELVHGLFFYLFTKSRPQFGFNGLYAYAAAPEWYIPKIPYLLIGLAPLIILTIVGTAALVFVPARFIGPWLFILTLNLAGAVGDVIVCLWLLPFPADALINDTGDVFSVYNREFESP